MKKEKFNAFEGKRYKDYDDLVKKRSIFKDEKSVKCSSCKKKLYKISEAFCEYNYLFCKKCFSRVSEENDKELSRGLEEIGL